MNIEISQPKHIFKVLGDKVWSRSHAQVPFALKLGDERVRVFYATRDAESCSSVCFFDTSLKNPSNILKVHDKPVLTKGVQGAHDDTGTMPSWFVYNQDRLWLYYTGWNKSESASYRLSIGLAESRDHGMTFNRLFNGPIMDRANNDPIWVGQPCVLRDEGIWKMWYLNCEKIEMIADHPEPFYNVKYATSQDGIDWKRHDLACIDFEPGVTDAIGRPCVWNYSDRYWMLHSNRRALGYRTSREASYRIVLSISDDGLHWTPYESFSLPRSADGSWDSLMNEYTSIIETETKGVFLVFYNGNGFGETGIGYFTLTIGS